MTTGRASVLVKPNHLETWDVKVQDPEPGGVLVKVVLAGVCGSDSHIVTGEAGVMPFPIVLGHEGIGRIEKLGAGVTADYASEPVKEGDLVYWAPIALCHRCYTCSVLDETPCENSQFFEHADKPNWGSYADFAWLPNGMAFYKVPTHAIPEAVAALGCQLPTVLRGFENSGPIPLGGTVVIQGAGAVGLSAALVASQSGAKDIIVLDQSDKRLAVARKLGATQTINISNTSAEERRALIYDQVGPAGPNVVVEAAGVLPAFPEGVDLTGSHGRYIILGLWGQTGKSAFPPRELTIKNMAITGATFPKPKHYYQALHMSARLQEQFNLADLVTDKFSIENAEQAIELVKTGATIKAVIDPSL